MGSDDPPNFPLIFSIHVKFSEIVYTLGQFCENVRISRKNNHFTKIR